MLDRAEQSISQAPNSVPAWPPPHYTKVELSLPAGSPFLCPALLSQFLPCDIFLVLFSLLIFSFGSVFYFSPPPHRVLLHCQTSSLAFHFPLLFRIYILTVITYLMTRLVWFSLIRVQEQTAKDSPVLGSARISTLSGPIK